MGSGYGGRAGRERSMEGGQDGKGRSHEKVSKPSPSVCFFCSSGLTLTQWSDLRGDARGHLSRPLYKSRIRREREHASRQQPETKSEKRERGREKPDGRAAAHKEQRQLPGVNQQLIVTVEKANTSVTRSLPHGNLSPTCRVWNRGPKPAPRLCWSWR